MKIKEIKFKPHNDKYTIIIKRSTVPGAGLGAFAGEDLPEGIYAEYKGKFIKDVEDGSYAWEIFKYDKISGEVTNFKKMIGVRDAINNDDWARYVNCSKNSARSNIDAIQHRDRMYYHTKRDIKEGEELFVWYGKAYYSELKEKIRKSSKFEK